MSSLKEEKNILFYNDLVDLSFLRENLSNDTNLWAQMISMFIEQNPEKIKLLEQAVLNKDFQAIKSHSHFLKSSFKIMGLSSENLLTEIESLSANNSDIKKIEALFKKVHLNFNKSVIEYKNILLVLQQKH